MIFRYAIIFFYAIFQNHVPHPRPLFITCPPAHSHINVRNAIIFRYAIYEGKHIHPQ